MKKEILSNGDSDELVEDMMDDIYSLDIAYYVGEAFIKLLLNRLNSHLSDCVRAFGIDDNIMHCGFYTKDNKSTAYKTFKLLSFEDIRKFKRILNKEAYGDLSRYNQEYIDALVKLHDSNEILLYEDTDANFILEKIGNIIFLVYNDSSVNFSIQNRDVINMQNDMLEFGSYSYMHTNVKTIVASLIIASPTTIPSVALEFVKSFLISMIDVDNFKDAEYTDLINFITSLDEKRAENVNNFINLMFINTINDLHEKLLTSRSTSEITRKLYNYCADNNLNVHINYSKQYPMNPAMGRENVLFSIYLVIPSDIQVNEK